MSTPAAADDDVLPPPPPDNCQVWVVPELRDDGCIYWTADSDSQLTKVWVLPCVCALCRCLVCALCVLCCAWGCLLNNSGLQVCLTLCRLKLLSGVSLVVVDNLRQPTTAAALCRAVLCCGVQGLAALLVLGLSGCKPAEILSVQPGFIELLGLKQSLTPSRNNGFLNMFLKMQKLTLGLVVSGWVWWVGKPLNSEPFTREPQLWGLWCRS